MKQRTQQSPQEWMDYPVAIIASVTVHIVLAVILVLGVDYKPEKVQPHGPVVQARLVDMTSIKDRKAAVKAAKKAAKDALIKEALKKEEKRKADKRKKDQAKLLKDAREKLKKKQEADAKALIDQRRKKQEEVKRQQKVKKLKDLAAKVAKDKKEKREREQRRMEEQLKQLDRLEKERLKAQKERQIEEQRLAQIEDARKNEAAKKLKEQEELRRQQLMDYENRKMKDAKLGDIRSEYVLAIQMQVTQNWLRPPTAKKGLSCKIRINQIPGGEVISANVIAPCNADGATRRSLIAAVMRARTLPYKGFEKVFERQLTFNFKY